MSGLRHVVRRIPRSALPGALPLVAWALLAGAAVPVAAEAPLRFGITDFPPWFVVEGDRIAGIVPDATEPILRDLGVEVQMIVRPIARLRSEVESGDVECRAMAYDPDDEIRYDFGRESLYRLAYGVFGRAEDGNRISLPERPEDFRDLELRWGLVHGLSYTPEMMEMIDGAGTTLRSWENEDNLLHLLDGRLDVVIAEPLTFLHLAAGKGVAEQIRLIEPALIVKDYHLACNREAGRADLLRRFDDELRTLRKGPEWDEILSRYLDGERRTLYHELTRSPDGD